MKTSRQILMKKIADHSGSMYFRFSEMAPDELVTHVNDVKWLISESYIRRGDATLGEEELILTEKGEQYLENGGFASPASSNISVNIGGDISGSSFVIGSGSSSVDSSSTVNHNTDGSFQALVDFAKSQSEANQKLIDELLADLQQVKQSGHPVSPGFFRRHAELLKGIVGIAAPIGEALIELFIL